MDWWVAYARLNEGQKQWAEAGKAWMSVLLATTDPAKHDEYLKHRDAIAQQSVDDAIAQKKREDDAKAAELERLKTAARKEIADAELRANSQNTKKNDNAPVVDWWDDANSSSLSGTLTQVDCAGKQLKLRVKDADGAVRVMLIADPSNIDVKGGGSHLAAECRRRARWWCVTASKAAGVFGEVTGIQYQ